MTCNSNDSGPTDTGKPAIPTFPVLALVPDADDRLARIIALHQPAALSKGCTCGHPGDHAPHLARQVIITVDNLTTAALWEASAGARRAVQRTS